jgi:hypothetical protein
MRDRETIDSELRLIANVRRSIREQGGQPSCREADELLDERLGHRAEVSETEAVEACKNEFVADAWSHRDETDGITPHQRKGVLRRFGPLMALPLSFVAVAAVLAVMFAVHNPHPAAQPTVVPPPGAPPVPPPGAPPVPPPGAPPAPPPGAPPDPAAPNAQAPQPPPLDIVDRAFIDGLRQVGVPVPSHEYVMIHGHAVCDFLAQQPNFAEAVRFVQRSSIWDANQSADFAAGAIVSYCPQYQPTMADEMQQAFQNALPDLQVIQGDLQGIQGDLQGIQGDLPAIPGQP